MAQTMISIRVENDLKQSFDALCKEFGLSTSAAMTLFMKAVVRERKIPFEIKADPSPVNPLQDMPQAYGMPQDYLPPQSYMPPQSYGPPQNYGSPEDSLSNTLYQQGALFDQLTGGSLAEGQRKMTLDDISYESVHAQLNGGKPKK